MADPLSIAAGIISVANAATQVFTALTDLVRRTKDAPKRVTTVLLEIRDIHIITTQLQLLVLDLEAPGRSQTCFIQADSVTAILTGCVSTFLELEELIEQPKARDPVQDFGLIDRMRWAAKETSIAAILSRVQAHKLSLSAILNIFNGSVAPLP